MLKEFIQGFYDLDFHWMNWTDLINHTCGGDTFFSPIYESDLEFNRNYFFNGLTPDYQKKV
ncbi:MAG: hypothetical protein R3321_03735 [Nitrososphaeraceae archaeon]|nr:hypothetical protein [Nitrososphaeraceae archaeon]